MVTSITTTKMCKYYIHWPDGFGIRNCRQIYYLLVPQTLSLFHSFALSLCLSVLSQEWPSSTSISNDQCYYYEMRAHLLDLLLSLPFTMRNERKFPTTTAPIHRLSESLLLVYMCVCSVFVYLPAGVSPSPGFVMRWWQTKWNRNECHHAEYMFKKTLISNGIKQDFQIAHYMQSGIINTVVILWTVLSLMHARLLRSFAIYWRTTLTIYGMVSIRNGRNEKKRPTFAATHTNFNNMQTKRVVMKWR